MNRSLLQSIFRREIGGWRIRSCRAVRAVVLFALAAGACFPPELYSVPLVPKHEDEALEKLRSGALDTRTREIREWKQRLASRPNEVASAIYLAKLYLERAREEGDPRFLGHAESVLKPWLMQAQAPIEAIILGAVIHQSRHEFEPALADLEKVLRAAPTNPQAWLTRASILTVLGRYEEAERSCLPLIRFAPELVAVTAAASVSTLVGDVARSCEILRTTLDRHPDGEQGVKVWALTILAEACVRLGDNERAEAHFRKALELGDPDPYLLGAFADFLLDQGRLEEVVRLLQEKTRIDPLLLRLAMAEAALNPQSTRGKEHVRMLRLRFDASRLRGDRVHLREEARFTLVLLHQPAEALRLAQENWQVQREPADARILLEAAAGARDAKALLKASEVVAQSGIKDVRLQKLMSVLTGTAP